MFGNWENCKCKVCESDSQRQIDNEEMVSFYICPVCGRYEIKSKDASYDDLKNEFDLNKLSPYLAYNGFGHDGIDRQYYSNRDREWCNEWSQKCKEGDITRGHPVFLSKENIENWYPKTFSEKIDKILLYLNKCIKHIGQKAVLTKEESYSVFFVDRYNYNIIGYSERADREKYNQVIYMLKYLTESNYIERDNLKNWLDKSQDITILLKPEGYSRIDELQRNMVTVNDQNVLVAMKFGEETKKLREAIRSGITEAGYIAIFIDEVQHNDFITPELLKYIENSRFIVADLTHKNNGAYFEEGYAMGMGKPVIQLCKKGVDLHFDVAQKNTIIWDSESDIPQRLKNRIVATID